MLIYIVFFLLNFSIFLYSQNTENTNVNQKQNIDQNKPPKILIDFSKYEQLNENETSPYPEKLEDNWQETDKNIYPITREDMKLDNWVVRLNSSSSNILARRFSYAKKITTKSGEIILGARIYFPSNYNNAYAFIKPYYEIMEYGNKGNMTNIQNGVLDNIDTIRSISVIVGGRNYKNSISIRLSDQNRKMHDFFMGYVNFLGFRRLTWQNNYHINNINNKDLFRIPLYPKKNPYYKFNSFIVGRPEGGISGDFIVYFKKVEIDYTLFNPMKNDLSIKDEDQWGILKFKSLAKRSFLKKINRRKKILKDFHMSRMGLIKQKANSSSDNNNVNNDNKEN